MPRVRRSAEDRQASEDGGPDYLEVLARGLRIVALFNAERRQMTLSELAALADAPRATVRRVLITLERLGFVAVNGRQFRLTPRVLTLASAYLASNTVALVMQSVVEGISRRLGEACSAAVLDRDEAVMVARASPARIMTIGLEVGYRLPAYCSSVGRVLLGALGEPELDAYLARVRPERLTPRTVTDVDLLRAIVASEREQGYSLVDQEAEHGFRSIAVPVRRRDGATVCALHVGVHADRVSLERMREDILPLLDMEARAAGELVV